MRSYFAYIRVSTAKQEQGASLAAQRAAIEQHAAMQGLEISEWFEETETAAKLGRRVFTQIVKRLSRGEASGVILHKIDRGARNLRDWADLGELLDRGIDIHFAHDNVDLRSRGGRLSADIQAVVAADYIRNLREECLKGIQARLRQGLYPRRAPLGYLDRGRGQAKVPDPLRAHLVQLAFELYASGGYSLQALTIRLNELGLRNRAGQPVSLNGIATILKNPFYTGMIRTHGREELYQGLHQPLVTRERFEAVQAIKQERLGRHRRRWRRARHRYSRRLVCGSCSRHLTGEIQKGHTYYRCHQCPGTSLREERVDEALMETFRAAGIEIDNKLEALFDRFVETCTVSGKAASVTLRSPVTCFVLGKFEKSSNSP